MAQLLYPEGKRPRDSVIFRDILEDVARNLPPRDNDVYWETRLERLHKRGKLCACECGERVRVSLDWLRERGEQRNVWLPKYLPGHFPLIPCGCGCGELIEKFDERGRLRKVKDVRHAARLTPEPERVDWQRRASEWNAKAPSCACGCGIRLHRTPDQMKSRIRDSKYLRGHGHRRSSLRTLDDVERSVVLGVLLGDVSISVPSHTPRLAFTHGLEQRDYAMHKMDVLDRLSWWWQEAQTSGYSQNRGIQGSSSCSPALAEIYELVRPEGGPKTVSREWLEQLDDRSLAYWLMDDGSVPFSAHTGKVSSAAFHTEGFTEPEQDLMVEWFRSRGYAGTTKAKSRGYWYLYLPREDARRLLEHVSPFVPDSMRYKVEALRG